ncbi:NAD(P)H-hydrate dehydratase [Pontibacillus sp. HMF3514]|uniref:NAD(P)H-hydrate dehydratase n=1 Tax=Pontibacillus sp. HMF3514 TaxID=2692425 RepID=UPI00131FDEBF|nr:NAD(P)H-hydrate dehydratase [Pontibacillus sp. HMF3514]QHE50835.1 NAD(P)H-hydrate dehydratase [Pontibacillus sp. HMF3514]
MYIVTAKEMYDLDRYAMDEIGLDGRLLMENAGRAVTDQIESELSSSDRVLVLIGKGNNGGDGFVLARTLMQRGYDVTAIQMVPSSKIEGDAAYHRKLFLNMGYSVVQYDGQESLERLCEQSSIIVDAMLGIGVKGEIRSPYREAIQTVNASQAYTISVDLPSGVPADEGVKVNQAVKADRTVVIQYPKLSAYLQHTAPFYGEWIAVDIGLPAPSQHKRSYWGKAQVQSTFPTRHLFSHKGKHGKGLVIGGASTMPGSVGLTSRAALKGGAGLLTLATVPSVIQALASSVLEATYISLKDLNGYILDVKGLDYSYDGIAIGMGMGRQEETVQVLQTVLQKASCPVVIDADGLYALQKDASMLDERESPSILTPHPGEMAHLLGVSIPELLSKPFEYTKSFAEKHHVFIVFKGAFTIITTPEGAQWVTDTGNSGLAKGGSGDALSGILLAHIMQDQSIVEALCNGTWIHGYTAELLTADIHSQYDLLANDVIEGLAQTYRTLSL